MASPGIPTLLRTLWYLRARQWRGQIARALGRGTRIVRSSGPAPRVELSPPEVPFLGAPAHIHCDAPEKLSMLNQEIDFSGGIDWETLEGGPLWRYQLHSFDWVRSASLPPEGRARMIMDWIERHPEGTGWDAWPISLRTINWIKLLAVPEALPNDTDLRERMCGSLADQLDTLEANLETHLLGNHYLWNRIALVMGGAALEGGRSQDWLGHADALERELDEQFGADGMHYERSPMYHALLVEHLLDLANVLRTKPGRLPRAFGEGLRARIARALAALETLTHPDGDIALFADSAHRMAPLPSRLLAYGRALGIVPAACAVPGLLRETGYVRLESGPFVLLASASVPLPSYLPGHAHCDALSFELSVAGQRAVTDTGVFEYVPGERRQLARATRSHATVAIDGTEQAELWSAHRIGGRPDVAWTSVEPDVRAVGVCAGYATPDVLHKRTFEFVDGALRIEDRFDRPAGEAELRLPLAPGLEASLEGRAARVALAGGTLVCDLPFSADWSLASAPAFPEFGKQLDRPVLVGRARTLECAEWTLRWEPDA